MNNSDFNAGYKQAVRDALRVCREEKRFAGNYNSAGKVRSAIGRIMYVLQNAKPNNGEQSDAAKK